MSLPDPHRRLEGKLPEEHHEHNAFEHLNIFTIGIFFNFMDFMNLTGEGEEQHQWIYFPFENLDIWTFLHFEHHEPFSGELKRKLLELQLDWQPDRFKVGI